MNRDLFFDPIKNPIRFVNLENEEAIFPENCFDFNPEALEPLLELFTRGSSQVDHSTFSADKLRVVTIPETNFEL